MRLRPLLNMSQLEAPHALTACAPDRRLITEDAELIDSDCVGIARCYNPEAPIAISYLDCRQRRAGGAALPEHFPYSRIIGQR